MSAALTALVVDDAEDVRLLLAHVLTEAGFVVTEAASGPEGLARLADGPVPDVVVLDVQMPDLDGWDTLASIRGGVAPTVAVIVCSVKAGPEDRRRAWLLGCDAYVSKPFDVADLIAEVRAVQARSLEERVAERARRLASGF
jgi:two-component system KDP operon response regulator KdpE